MSEDIVCKLDWAARDLYLSARWRDSCERMGVADDLQDQAERELINARNRLEDFVGDLLASYGVRADVELHRIEVDGME